MKVSPAGVVEWSVPEKATGEQQIILGVTDAAGQECLQSFTLTVVQ
jgi:hypothetical protein